MPHKIYRQLKRHYSKKFPGKSFEEWWPVSRKFTPIEWEICVGTILTQNTNWNNVEKALRNLEQAGFTTMEKIASSKRSHLEMLVRPSGFFKQKARRLKELAAFMLKNKEPSRDKLLKLNGVGPETADSILLYALNKPFFVIDAYTRRLFSRIGTVDERADYEELRQYFEEKLPKKIAVYKEFHALIVEHAKRICKKEPLCGKCVLNKKCEYGKNKISQN